MSKKLDYEKRGLKRNFSAYSTNYERNCLSNVSTKNQHKYAQLLSELCKKHGVPSYIYEEDNPTLRDRGTLSRYISTMRRNLIEAGVDLKTEIGSINRYKFDKNGNVYDTVTNKIVKKRREE